MIYRTRGEYAKYYTTDAVYQAGKKEDIQLCLKQIIGGKTIV